MRRSERRISIGLYRSLPDRKLLETALDLGIRSLDTSFNYGNFSSHRTLSSRFGSLLTEFSISTKVGFFPGINGVEHSLDIGRLRDAILVSVDELNVVPGAVLLHNPERTLSRLAPMERFQCLAAACSVLVDATRAGLCHSWGISTWDPRVIQDTLPADDLLPKPQVLMVRAGLSVSAPILSASEALVKSVRSTTFTTWGMSPFGGNGRHPAWNVQNTLPFIGRDQNCTPAQAAFRAAYELPVVDCLTVGTSSVEHLRDLVDALDVNLDSDVINRYREIIRGLDRDL
ncbi:hypothetical protein DMH01_41460 [Amycolatopsis sp. WAC 04182]|uniref:aldo/keto reductase n=1 Tax=Amycolatopsis sp. WAC 04182 TaxID=2203198 RepID=UPI000F7AECDA|nr:aldo/keto reductase [Amycolatopsis sp. WAC 04182]RSN52642.1 hypothetical protein DMH01_41460 [Amycolatopsis sp. WAC 04182]